MRSSCRFRFLLLAAVLQAACSLYAAAPRLLWTNKLPSDAKWHEVSSVGYLLVGTADAVLCIDPESGATLWKDNTLKKTSSFNVREVAGTPVIIANMQSGIGGMNTVLTAIDSLSGKHLWEEPKIMGQYLGIIPLPDQGLVLMLHAGHDEAQGNGTFIFAYDLASGALKWKTKYAKQGAITLHLGDNSGLFSPRMDLSGHQEPLLEGTRLYLPYLGVHCLDLESGAILWGVPFDPADKVNKRAYPALRLVGDQLFAGGGGEIYCINRDSGALLWKSNRVAASGLKVWKDSVLSQIEVMGNHVFVRMGGNYSDGKQVVLKKPLGVLALDRSNGHELWRSKDIDNGITNLLQLPEQNVLLCADGDSLIGIDANASTYTEVYKVKIEFKRKMGGGDIAKLGLGALGGLSGLAKAAGSSSKSRMDVPIAIVQSQGKVSVVGRQHLLGFDPTAKKIDWSLYYAAPSSTFANITMFAVTALAATAGNAQASQGTYGSSTYNQGVGNIHSALDNYSSYNEKRALRVNSRAGDGYTYILTNIVQGKKKRVGIVGVNQTTGETERELPLDTKEPDYLADEEAGRIFFFKGKDTVEAYQF